MRLIVLILVLLFQGVGSAIAFCSKPSAPYCAERYDAFADEYEFRSCRSEMDSYRSEIEDFTNCNNREAQEAIDKARRENEEALNEYNEAVSSFNNRAGR
ncbi:hypothetical protein [Taklimakanibacter albus]|uniref:Uncharacterized protein n=1 Tax=Taklimakanibacter albus TaxID=2800327 RepID=A0ACC5R1A5_9HYPH|nr:hypothetical protein [Aestuariivirga sp. YIM B02566]MBK1866388.1 hypothetical protein [Aestuariivirga sp. YIM B02566]